MKNLNELCQKSADRLGVKDKSELSKDEIRAILNEPSDYSPSFTEFCDENVAIMLVVDKNAPKILLDIVLATAKVRIKYIVFLDEAFADPERIFKPYENKITTVDKTDVKNFNYYGSSSANAPVLFTKMLSEVSSVIVLSEFGFDKFLGFKSAADVAMRALAFPKTADKFYAGVLEKLEAKELDFKEFDKNTNELTKGLRDIIVTISARIGWFGLNYVLNDKLELSSLSAGDIFISGIALQEPYKKMRTIEAKKGYDGVMLSSCSNDLVAVINDILEAAKPLKKGARLLLEASSLKYFYADRFEPFFNIASLDELYEKIPSSENVYYGLYAYILRKLASVYNIAFDSEHYSENDIALLRQAGLNPIKKEEFCEFMKNCEKTAYFENVSGFKCELV